MKPTVLIVDDKPNFLALLEKVLRDDALVVRAVGVREALATLEALVLDAVVCDLRMRDGDGLDVLRAMQARASTAPFILMTAYATVENAVQVMREGAYDYVTKPFDPDVLRALVLRALGDAAARRLLDAPRPSEALVTRDGIDGRAWTALTYREASGLARDAGLRRYLEALLAQHRGNVTVAASQAGLERESFHRLLRRHGLRAEPFRPQGDTSNAPSTPPGAAAPQDDDPGRKD